MRPFFQFALPFLLALPAAAADRDRRFFANDEPTRAGCEARLSYAPDREQDVLRQTGMAMKQYHLGFLLDEFLPKTPPPYLEVGPWRTPALRPRDGVDVVYWDVDLGALRNLLHWGWGEDSGIENPHVHPIYIDLNAASATYRRDFDAWNRRLLGQFGSRTFRLAVVSQVLNYVDHERTLNQVAQFQAEGDLLFVVNQVDAGDAEHFHPRRPRRATDVDRALARAGYEILRRERPKLSREPTITWVARKR